MIDNEINPYFTNLLNALKNVANNNQEGTYYTE